MNVIGRSRNFRRSLERSFQEIDQSINCGHLFLFSRRSLERSFQEIGQSINCGHLFLRVSPKSDLRTVVDVIGRPTVVFPPFLGTVLSKNRPMRNCGHLFLFSLWSIKLSNEQNTPRYKQPPAMPDAPMYDEICPFPIAVYTHSYGQERRPPAHVQNPLFQPTNPNLDMFMGRSWGTP